MRLLHTEGSQGWGGQEIRILKEAVALREEGYEIIFAVQPLGQLAQKAREEGFLVYEVSFAKGAYALTLFRLIRILSKHKIDIVVTHSSSDAWIAGIAARATGKKIVRTRHLSTKIKQGINSKLLYNFLADYVVTTSSSIIPMIQQQSGIDPKRVLCVPTGVDPKKMEYDVADAIDFRKRLGLTEKDILIGTACIVRSWKGIPDLIRTAFLLKDIPNLHWVIIGGGYIDQYCHIPAQLGVEDRVTFTGHFENPASAIAALDIFMLLSTAHEGISQASLQAAFLKKPLVTTSVGGLPEVCLDGITGFVIPPHSPEEAAKKVQLLMNEKLRREFGEAASDLVKQQFLFQKTADTMVQVYSSLGETR
jgi:glycosyltransferase involved in cell wall biosynthesis